MVQVPDVVGDLSLGFLSLPANAIAPILFVDRWSNQPSRGGMDGTLFPGFVPMFQAWFWVFVCACVRLRTEGVAFRMVWGLPDLQVFRSPVVSIFSAAVVAAGVFRLRVTVFCIGVTFGPLRVDSGFWPEPHFMYFFFVFAFKYN
ncbi:hypothetical protein C1H46_043835 [Malus baccata]|uniref:Uncharacterized protein n=1 Tax=Malus baccata TaxID=106549 RepID=A0A540K8T8_MALBA|nr:hypothetical protein C1H46_043835 [Malus baccata]